MTLVMVFSEQPRQHDYVGPTLAHSCWLRWSNVGNLTLAQCKFAHRPYVGPTCWPNVGTTLAYFITALGQRWPNNGPTSITSSDCINKGPTLAQRTFCVGPTMAQRPFTNIPPVAQWGSSVPYLSWSNNGPLLYYGQLFCQRRANRGPPYPI